MDVSWHDLGKGDLFVLSWVRVVVVRLSVHVHFNLGLSHRDS